MPTLTLSDVTNQLNYRAILSIHRIDGQLNKLTQMNFGFSPETNIDEKHEEEYSSTARA